MSLLLTGLPGIPLIQSGDDLGGLILQALSQEDIELQDGDILVVSQKVVSKAEGRLVNLNDIHPSSKACEFARITSKDPRLVELILKESLQVLRVREGVMIVQHRLGFICASAGIDHSNVAGNSGSNESWVLLLPEDPDASAKRIRLRLENASGRRLGVLIIDSHGRAWRLGTVGMTIGLSGLPGLVDMRGWKDLFGCGLRITLVGAADELAAAASLVMGQSAESIPVVHVRGFPYPLREGTLKELLRPEEEDLFR
jgi:coenzyme F420-0:L-glutamate ligase/coenzyme F420-1:gamma-L-glutamate ligase